MSSKPLFNLETMPKSTYHITQVMHAWAKFWPSVGLPNFKECYIHFKDGTSRLLFNKKEFEQMGKMILEKLLKQPEWFAQLNRNIEMQCVRLMKLGTLLKDIDHTLLDNSSLGRLIEYALDAKMESHFSGIPAGVLDIEFYHFTNHLHKLLQLKGNQGLSKQNEAFRILTTPTKPSFGQLEEQELFGICEMIKNNPAAKEFFTAPEARTIEEKLPGTFPEIDQAIHEHYQRYCWLCYMYQGPAYKKDYFISRIQGILKQGLIKKSIPGEFQAITEEKKRICEELGLTEEEKMLFQIAEETLFLKGYRKDALFFWAYCAEGILREAAARLGITLLDTRFLLGHELRKALSQGNFDPGLGKQRFKESLLISTPEKTEIITSNMHTILNLVEEEQVQQVSELKGQCAYEGKATGKVRIINTTEDLPKMQQGDILVSIATTPDLVPAMRKAAAIITDMGGITCHAAIVSREMKIPCVVGTRIATKVLKGGMDVEVDAVQGIIKIIGNSE